MSRYVGGLPILSDNITVPCKCRLPDEGAVLEKIDTDKNGSCVFGLVRFGKSKLRVLFQDIVLEDLKAMDYVNAYKYWCRE
ncbi:MAG: hypothetical protein ABIC04_03345 [Nanoarchaeota archaeon]